MRELRIIVAGSRRFDDFKLLEEKLLSILDAYKEYNRNSDVFIISGGAQGADALGEKFAAKHGVNCIEFKANWNGLGKSAGIIRNLNMARYALYDESEALLVVFWNGTSRGTKHMIKTAERSGIKTEIVLFEDNSEKEIVKWE